MKRTTLCFETGEVIIKLKPLPMWISRLPFKQWYTLFLSLIIGTNLWKILSVLCLEILTSKISQKNL